MSVEPESHAEPKGAPCTRSECLTEMEAKRIVISRIEQTLREEMRNLDTLIQLHNRLPIPKK